MQKRLFHAACFAVIALACLPVTGAWAFGGAYVRGQSFLTGWRATNLLIRVACPPRTQSTPRPGDFSFCTGTLTVRHRGRVIASGPFSIRTFDSHIERVRVRASARHFFRPHRGVRVRWTARSRDGQGHWATNSGNVNPYSRL